MRLLVGLDELEEDDFFFFFSSKPYLVAVIIKLSFVEGAPYMAISPDLFPRAANPAEK